MDIIFVLQQAVGVFAQILRTLIFIRIILMFFMRARGGSGFGMIIDVVFRITDPIIEPLRAILQKSPISGASLFIDFSSLFAFFLINAFSVLLINILQVLR